MCRIISAFYNSYDKMLENKELFEVMLVKNNGSISMHLNTKAILQRNVCCFYKIIHCARTLTRLLDLATGLEDFRILFVCFFLLPPSFKIIQLSLRP